MQLSEFEHEGRSNKGMRSLALVTDLNANKTTTAENCIRFCWAICNQHSMAAHFSNDGAQKRAEKEAIASEFNAVRKNLRPFSGLETLNTSDPTGQGHFAHR